MTIREWFVRKGVTVLSFQAKLPICPHWVTVSRWKNGRRKPSKPWLRIIRAVYKDFPCS